MYKKYIKRCMDFLSSLIFLIMFSWVYLFLVIMVRINLGSPVLFSQERPGKDEKIFKLYKFRTMTNTRNEKGELLPDSERLTKFGKVLRSTSLDELPEIFNILRGDMSVVGPRPLLVEYLPYYTNREKIRHTVKPGLTGWAQINGRNYLKWDDRLQFDVEYVEKCSFFFDLKILFFTIWKVIKRCDVAEKRITPLDKERVHINRLEE